MHVVNIHPTIKKAILLIGCLGLSACAMLHAMSHATTAFFPSPAYQAFARIDVVSGKQADDFMADVYTWTDSQSEPRSAIMIPNTQEDPLGHYGGYMRRYIYKAKHHVVDCLGSSRSFSGFGFVVNHFIDAHGNFKSVNSRNFLGLSTSYPLRGQHHVIHQYQTQLPIGEQKILVTMAWFFATGIDHPRYAITFDSSLAPANSIKADTRAPYGDIQWDGGANAYVSGIRWGDAYVFQSLGERIDLNNGWDYTQPNIIPFVQSYATDVDREMGLVQTQSYLQHDAGGYGFYRSWGKRNIQGPMPDPRMWTYQINQYQLLQNNDPTAKRLAWGMNYGAVGQLQYPSYGEQRQLSGYPYQSYSVHVVLGEHSQAAVQRQVHAVETALQSELTAAQGVQVLTAGPAGLARADTQAYTPVGYNPIFGTWELSIHNTTDSPQHDLQWQLKSPRVLEQSPIFVLHNWPVHQTIETVKINNTELLPNNPQGYYASWDSNQHQFWLTIAQQALSTANTQYFHVTLSVQEK